MERFMIFVDAADDAAMFPVSNLQSVTCFGDGVVVVKFAPGSLGDGQAASIDSVTLTVSADSEKAVMQSIADAVSKGYNTPSVVIADDVASEYVDSNITACAITVDA
jgi:hypothetical protein